MKNLKYFWIASAVVVAMWLFSAFGYPWLFEEIKLEDLAQKGDSFGAVNALFSGLAFAGLIYTMIMQRQELEMQREELAAQRKEMRESRGELEEQNRIQKLQLEAMVRQMHVDGLKVEFDIWKASYERGGNVASLEVNKERMFNVQSQIVSQARTLAKSGLFDLQEINGRDK